MSFFFHAVLTLVVLQRVFELLLARRNRLHIIRMGGQEIGADHYKYLVGLHVLFFLSLTAEVSWRSAGQAVWWWIPFALFLLAQLARYWCIRSLGRCWNTRIYVIPGRPLIRRGPYRYVRHPNYWVVAIELLTLPLVFSAYATALVFSVLNAWLLLRVRIPAEERGLALAEKKRG